MSSVTAPAPRRRPSANRKRIAVAIVAVLVLIAMFFGTKIVPAGSTIAQGPKAFSASAYGKKQFGVAQSYIEKNATPASTLAPAIQADQSAAGTKYGTLSSDGVTVEVPVSFTGVVGQVPAAGFTPVTVQGVDGVQIAVQLGPAITGTDLRDVTGKVQLGDFENQIQYQNAGSAINDRLKSQVLSKVGDPSSLTGKTITVQGVFSLVNPAQWNVTPATLTVQQ